MAPPRPTERSVIPIYRYLPGIGECVLCDWCHGTIPRESHVVIRPEGIYLFHDPRHRHCKSMWLAAEAAMNPAALESH